MLIKKELKRAATIYIRVIDKEVLEFGQGISKTFRKDLD